ncbi:MarR family transcriptional regulator [Microbacterium foliorum]|uniref:Transcriptional regulator SlyA n=2 Tax=Microbacterium foliorum TaxID=104336 RepID=A0A0F0KPF8_9MICO|nr:MarR family transcriptional regulator [Microbacterium foliorum]KJL21146.1 Transcriptional regulator SlyA [Microbacterium foliorum]
MTDAGEGVAALEAEVSSRIGTFLKRAEQALIAEKTRVLRPFDLTVAQYAAMLALHYAPGQSAAQLARAAAVTPQTMAAVLGSLESKQLIERVVSTLHAKVLVVTLTDAGEDLVMKADVEAKAVEARLKRAFTAPESMALISLLERSIDALAPIAEVP